MRGKKTPGFVMTVLVKNGDPALGTITSLSFFIRSAGIETKKATSQRHQEKSYRTSRQRIGHHIQFVRGHLVNKIG